jgi:hypothetical protein
MFTQSMPALAQALSGALPEAALRQLMQSLGNCQQPLTHRGAINIQPPGTTLAGGLARPGTWRTSDYTPLLPTAGDDVFVDMPGNQYNTTNNSTNYGGNQFSFPINQAFNYSNYYGGDTFNVAGNSTFDNSTVNNLTTNNLTTNNITIINQGGGSDPGGGGRGSGGGGTGGGGNGGGQNGGGGGGFGGPGPGVPQPASTEVATLIKDVTVTGDVDAPTVSKAYLKSTDVTLTPGTQTVPVTVTGTVSVPVAQSGKIGALSATGTISIPTVNGGSLSGATASGNISYDTYSTATCGPITASVNIPTSGTFSGAPTGITASAAIGSLAGQVTFDVPTGGYLDAACKLVLTTTSVTKTIVLSGAPTVSITNQGTVSGSVALTQPGTSRDVTVTTPTITLHKTTGSVTPTLTVTGGTFTPTTTNKDQAVNVTTTAATVSITNSPEEQILSATGEIQAPTIKSAKIDDGTVSLDEDTTSKKLNLKVAKKSDFLIYLRPRA